MALRSHVDPVLYSRFILFDESDIGEKYVSALKTENPDELQQVVNEIFKHHPRVSFHEAYHCFQGLKTPFLHRYAIVAWYAFTRIFRDLCQGAEDHRTWAIKVPMLELLTQKRQYAGHMGGGIRPFIGQELSILDIVEGVTSLIEWQLYAHEFKQSPYDVTCFQRWQKRNAMYSKLYEAASAVVGMQRALSSAIALGTAALYTSQPIVAYYRLLLILEYKIRSSNYRRHFDSVESCVRSEMIFEFLNVMRYEETVNATHDLLDTRLFRLRLPFGDSLPKEHPFFVHSTRGSGLFSAPLGEKEWFMYLVHPEVFSNIRSVLEDNFAAPMTRIKIRRRDGSFHAFSMVHPQYGAPYNRDKSAAGDFARLYSVIISVIRRASGRFYATERTCELRACPEWEHNFCSAYIFTPSVHTKCQFLLDLERFRKQFGKGPRNDGI